MHHNILAAFRAMRKLSCDCWDCTKLARRHYWAAVSTWPPASTIFPVAGDEVGPYFLRRELGRGSFARVFLAEQVNLERRLVVVKVRRADW